MCTLLLCVTGGEEEAPQPCCFLYQMYQMLPETHPNPGFTTSMSLSHLHVETSVRAILMPFTALQSVVHSLSQQLADAQAAEAAAAALAQKAVAECAAVTAQRLLQSAVAPAQPRHASASPGQGTPQSNSAARTASARPSAVEALQSSPAEAELSADDSSCPADAKEPESQGNKGELAAGDRGCPNCAVLREDRAEMARMMHEMEAIVQQVYGSTIAAQPDLHDAGRVALAAFLPAAAFLSPCLVGGVPAAMVSTVTETPISAQRSSNLNCPGSAGGSSASMGLPQSEAGSAGKAHMAERGLPGSSLQMSPVAADQTPCAIADTPHVHQAGSQDGNRGSSVLRQISPGGRAQWLACRVADEVAQLCASSATPQQASAAGTTHRPPATMLSTPADGLSSEALPAIGAQPAASGGAMTVVDVWTPGMVRAMVHEPVEAVLTLMADNNRVLRLLTSQMRPFMAE